MSNRSDPPRSRAVPNSRLSRMARMGGLAAGIAGSVVAGGGRELLSGRKPRLESLLLTPSNAQRLTNELSKMRGAAMKVGQLLSMEASDLLSPELADILGRLQADAHIMPPKQLKSVLVANWGSEFLKRFKRFDVRPIAAASIGQVHRATTHDGRDVAIKVQYPGVRESIDSDIKNVAALIKLSGMVPKGVDLTPLFEQARMQLHEEADYQREGAYLLRFGDILADDPHFRVPAHHPDLSTRDLLGMEFVPSLPLSDLDAHPQELRDWIGSRLVSLLLRELFDLGLMQTDPNFANYRYDDQNHKIVLLDFGATRELPVKMSEQYRRLLAAGVARDDTASYRQMIEIGFFDDDLAPDIKALVLDVFNMAMEPIVAGGLYDFGQSDLIKRLREKGLDFAEQPDFLPIPPIDTLYLQRKIGGIYLLLTRLRARVDMTAAFAPYLDAA